ncbi:transketolase [Coriobacteriia bacterium Es71-Z0120]|uniref:transketolase n=1 Tax=Parvivirga hydrogeniphila TaxID=2939460 RepID=UPI002260B3EC|nr:transketolase [Parvivirga hydrogeniphila]MCL4078927.1 transketolase [Parvivirga hydrogeniphila]
MVPRGFVAATLDEKTVAELEEKARQARGAILTMTTLAASGHPGGSMSSLEMYLVLWSFANVDPEDPWRSDRDRIVVSHGHTSPGVYAVLGQAGFFDLAEAIAHFRQAGSIFEGHVEPSVPGVEWATGNLGQGLSAGVGFALASRMSGGCCWRTFVAMSDGEQHKGQVAEARRLAAKEGLTDLTVVVDLNGIQISGKTSDVMPVDVARDFAADGWGVIEVDGHDVRALYDAIASAVADTHRPVAVIAHTVIGKGVSFMEGKAEYHGRALTLDEYERAMGELGLEPVLDRYAPARSARPRTVDGRRTPQPPAIATKPARPADDFASTDCRSAWGRALADIAEQNPGVAIAVLDCDLASSVKTDAFARVRPEGFVQCGVGEHNAATVAGALSVSDVLTFWSDFGVFGIDEAYNQQRLNDINATNVRLVLTHCGLDVGEDGKTHQCLDYVGAFRNLFGWRVVVPADPIQTYKAVVALADAPGNVAFAMGRSKLPPLADRDGKPWFASGYEFAYGGIDWVRDGADGVVLVMGTPSGGAVEAADRLAASGASVAVGVVSAPLDLPDSLSERIGAAPFVLCVEDHHWRTGLWASVVEHAAQHGIRTRFVPLGVTGYQGSGHARDLYRVAGLDADGIERRLRELLSA